MHTSRPSSPRPAYTLVELLVVMALFVVLCALAYALVPRMFSSHRRVNAVEQVVQWLVSARQRAKRDGVPTGVRLLLDDVEDEGGSVLIRRLQYVQQPEPLTGGWRTRKGVFGGECVAVEQGVVTFRNVDFLGGAGAVDEQLAQPGDHLELRGGGTAYLIATVAADRLVLDDNTVDDPDFAPTTNYRILRRPRPLPGEKPLDIPSGTVIDLGPPVQTDPATGQPLSFYTANPTRSVRVPERLTGGGPSPRKLVLEIVFSPRGAVLSPHTGKVILWVRDAETRPDDPRARSLIAIHTATGLVAVHAVAPGESPYRDTEDGRASGR